MLGLKLPTDPRWVNIVEKNIDEILTDHAYCEQKAASTAISLIIGYPEYTELVAEMTGAEISFLQNPRKEADENDLKVSNECFLAEGLEPTRLAEGLLTEVIEISQRYAERIDIEKIPCASFW